MFLPLGIGPYPVRLATVIFMWAALAGSWNLLAGYAGAVDLGPVVYYGLGAFVTAAGMVKGGLPFLLSLALAGVVAMAIAFAVGTPTLRLRGAYFAIGTLALAESGKQLALAWDRLTKIPLTGGSAGISLPLDANYVLFYYVMLALMTSVTAAALWLRDSKFGYGLRAVGENDRLAEASGVDIHGLKRRVYVGSALVIALTGGTAGYWLSYINAAEVFSAVHHVPDGGDGAARRPRHALRAGARGRVPHPVLRASRDAVRVPLPDRDRRDHRDHPALPPRRPGRARAALAAPTGSRHRVNILEVLKVTKHFGSLVALNDVDLTLEEGEILGIIGPNGAGKSTLFNIIAGLERPTAGAVRFRGRSIAGLGLDAVCRLGIAKTFQIPQLFPRLTVDENVLVAALYGHGSDLAAARREARDWLAFVGLGAKTECPRTRSPSRSGGGPTSPACSPPARR